MVLKNNGNCFLIVGIKKNEAVNGEGGESGFDP